MKRTPMVRKTPMARGKGFAAMTASTRKVLTVAIDVTADGLVISDGRSSAKLLRAVAIKPSGKRLKQTRSTGKPTTAQVERWDRMRGIGCIACMLNEIDHDHARVPRMTTGLHAGNQEIHHLTSGGRRIGHDATICLCRFHHTGDLLPRYELGYRTTSEIYGPSFGHGRKPFAAFYGTDVQLLEYQNLVLAKATILATVVAS